MSMKRGGILALGAAALLAAAIAAGGRGFLASSSPRKPEAAGASAASVPRAPLPAGPSAGATPPRSPELRDEPAGLSMEPVVRLEAGVLLGVRAALKNGGGARALALIRERIRGSASADLERVAQAFHARLIAFVAAEDPAALPAALALSGEILRDASLHPWIRAQAVASLAGIPSTGITLARVGDGPLLYAFRLDPEAVGERGPYEASLAEAVRADATAGALLLEALARDPSDHVREAAAMGAMGVSAPGAADALAAAALGDVDPRVREAAFRGLVRAGAPALDGLARKIVLAGDQTPGAQGAALDVLARAAAAGDGGSLRFVSDCLAAGTPPDALAALTVSAFAIVDATGASDIRSGLTSLLLRSGLEDEEVLRAFVEQASARGRAEFLPLFQALGSTLPEDSLSKEIVAEGVRRLTNAPAYAAQAAELGKLESRIKALWGELNRPETAPARRAALREEISALMAVKIDRLERLEK